MYCVFNATTSYDADQGNPLGWPFESQYGYFCDQRDKSLYMLSSGLFNMLAIVVAYLVVVLYLGPKLMENRKPLEIHNVIRLYNFSMILMNCYLIKRALTLVDYGRSFFNCKGVEIEYSRTDEIAQLTELFLLSRLADFLDTIWFVLRKKHSHISFLHVFHHSYVPTVAYLATRTIPISPNAMSLPFINSGIHVVMYTYYLLATYPALRPHLWWKRYLTGLQMMQFITVLVYNIFGYFFFSNYCGKVQTTALVGSLLSAAIFLALFYSFYQKAYVATTTTTSPKGSTMAPSTMASGSRGGRSNGDNDGTITTTTTETRRRTTRTTLDNNHHLEQQHDHHNHPNNHLHQRPLLGRQELAHKGL